MQQVDYSLLGTRIRLKRKEMGITQAEMAERCGVSVPFIGHIERGSRAPSMESFLGICRVLHVTPDFLLQDYIEFEVMENARNSKSPIPICLRWTRSPVYCAKAVRNGKIDSF